MKKIILSIISAIMAVALLFTVTGCSTETELYFNNFYDSEYPLTAGYTETCTYDLTLNQSFNDELKKNETLNSVLNEISVVSGSYTTRLSVTPAIKGSNEQWKGSDISEISDIKEVLCFETELNLVLSVNNTVQNQDSITTKTYFCPKDFAYAPIHTTTNYDCTTVSVIGTAIEIGRQVYTSTTVYNKARDRKSVV